MKTILKRFISIVLTAGIIAGMFVGIPLLTKAASNGRDVEVVLAADAVNNNLDLTGFSDKLKAKLSSTYGIPTDKVHVSAVDSTSASTSGFSWYQFEHTNTGATVDDATNYIVNYNDPNIATKMARHIVLEGNGDITFYGYGVPAFKDFLYTPNTNADNKIFTFTINEQTADYHTFDGGGFLFGASYTYSGGTRKLSGYIILIGASNVGLYEVKDIDVNSFVDEQNTTFMGNVTSTATPYSYWGGTVKLLATTSKPAAVNNYRYLKLVASPTSASLYQFSDNTYSTTSSGGVIFDDITLPETFGSFGFGPIASYQSHNCGQQTVVHFNNITLKQDTSVGFADLVRSTSWQYPTSMKLFVNVDNNGVSDFAVPSKLGSILYYTMQNNAHYVGWGLNNTISLGGYSTVQDQANGFISRNNGKGTFINRSTSSLSTLDNGVDALAAYIAGQLDQMTEISSPTLQTTFNGNGQVVCSATDTKTSKGNAISGYQWRCLNVATGQWETEPVSSNSTSFTFAQGTYNIVSLRIQDSVTGQWSDYAQAYIATDTSVAPVSQFTLDKSELMPDTSIDALRTGTAVTAQDTSYHPNGEQITNWEWHVYDAQLNEVSSLEKSYTSSNKPAGISFDFASQPAGTYTIKLKTKKGTSPWSSEFSRQVTVYKESSKISVTGFGDISSTIPYSGTKTLNFTLSTSAGSITAYRLIKIKNSDQSLIIDDWTKASSSSVSGSGSLTGVSSHVYVQVKDSSGDSKTQDLGTYLAVPRITAAYADASGSYTSGTPTNKDVSFTSADGGLQYSVNNGDNWSTFTSPMTATGKATYVFRFAGETNTSAYITLQTDINKVFAGSLTGVENNGKYTSGVSPVVQDASATISKNGAAAVSYDGSPITDDGRYTLVLTDTYGNTQTCSFVIDSVAPALTVNGNTDEWTHSDVVLNLSKTLGVSGEYSLNVTYNGGAAQDITGSTSYTAKQNGTYVFTLTNGVGQTISKTVEVNKIDKVTPGIQIQSVTTAGSTYHYSSDVPTENDVTVTLNNPNNVLSGVTYYYSKDDGSTWNAFDGSSFVITDTANAADHYLFKAVSGSGLESVQTASIPVYIVKPSYSGSINIAQSTSQGVYNGEWTNKDVNFSLSGGINSEAFLKYQYASSASPDDWTDITGTTLTVHPDQNAVYSFRIVSKGLSAGSETKNIIVKQDNTAPTNVAIKVDNNVFKSFINTISFGLFFKETQDVTFSANADISGVNHFEYQVIDTQNGQKYDENGTWQTGSSVSVTPQFKGVIYARAVDNASNVSGVVSTDGVTVENIAPAVTGVAEKTYYIGRVINYSDNFNDIKSAVYSKDGQDAVSFESGKLFSEPGRYTVTVEDNTGNSTALTFTIKALPSVSDVVYTADCKALIDSIRDEYRSHSDLPISYNVDTGIAVSALEDRYAQLNAAVTDSRNTEQDLQKKIDGLAGKTDGLIALRDDLQKALDAITSSSSTMTPEQKTALTAESTYLQQKIAQIEALELQDSQIADRVNAVPKNTDGLIAQKDTIQTILNDISKLTAEQQAILKPQTDTLKNLVHTINTLQNQVDGWVSTVKALPAGDDGMIGRENTIRDIQKSISGLTNEQQNLLKDQSQTLDGMLQRITELSAQVDDLKNKADKIPTAENGLIAQKGTIDSLLTSINGLTPEQQKLLNTQINNLNASLSKIATLQKQADTVKGLINALPQPEAVVKEDKERIATATNAYNALNDEQKTIVGTQAADKLSKVVEALNKLLLYDAPNDVTVTSVDGKAFSADTYLVVDKIEQSKNPEVLGNATSYFAIAERSQDELKNREIVALYDVSMFRGDTKIQPDGRVKVRIKIPDNLKGREGLEIVHIADGGAVTSMHATIDGDYIEFITDHFSNYAIIAVPLFPWWILILIAIVLTTGTWYAIHRHRKKKREQSANHFA